MTASKVLLTVGLALFAEMAEAQKNTGGGGGQAPAPSPEALVAASDPQSVVDAMNALGYTATLGVDNFGDPIVNGEIDGTAYDIFFYGCVENVDCLTLLFSAGFDLPNGWTLEAVNDWHAKKIVTDVHLDEEMDPFIQYFVTTEGGLNQTNFADVMEFWQVILGEFKTEIGF